MAFERMGWNGSDVYGICVYVCVCFVIVIVIMGDCIGGAMVWNGMGRKSSHI